MFERAAADLRQTFDYDGWTVDEYSAPTALRGAAQGRRRSAMSSLSSATRDLMTEFGCRISASDPIDYYDGDEPDPDAYDLGPGALGGDDVADALESACSLAVQFGWVAQASSARRHS